MAAQQSLKNPRKERIHDVLSLMYKTETVVYGEGRREADEHTSVV